MRRGVGFLRGVGLRRRSISWKKAWDTRKMPEELRYC